MGLFQQVLFPNRSQILGRNFIRIGKRQQNLPRVEKLDRTTSREL